MAWNKVGALNVGQGAPSQEVLGRVLRVCDRAKGVLADGIWVDGGVSLNGFEGSLDSDGQSDLLVAMGCSCGGIRAQERDLDRRYGLGDLGSHRSG